MSEQEPDQLKADKTTTKIYFNLLVNSIMQTYNSMTEEMQKTALTISDWRPKRSWQLMKVEKLSLLQSWCWTQTKKCC